MPYWVDVETPASWAALDILGATFRRARRAHHWTQLELERRTGVDQSTISLFERGLNPGMRVMWLVRLATALGLDVEGLAPRHRFVDDAVLEALRIANLDAQGRLCRTCRRPI